MEHTSGPGRQLGAVYPSCGRQRLRRRDGRPRALGLARAGPGGLRAGEQNGDPLLPYNLWDLQTGCKLLRRSSLRPFRAQVDTVCRVARGATGAAHNNPGAVLGLDRGSERTARDQPGAILVRRDHHEDRPGRTVTASPRDGVSRGCLRASPRAVLAGYRLRLTGAPPYPVLGSRDTRTRQTRSEAVVQLWRGGNR